MREMGAIKFRNIHTPRQPGEIARLRVIQGPDFGMVFVITAKQVRVGRDETCEVSLRDLKASRMHAELSLGSDGVWILKDLSSSNGILLNQKEVKSSPIQTGSTFTVGETMLEFRFSTQEETRVLTADMKSALQVQSERKAHDSQLKRVRDLSKFGGGKAQPAVRGTAQKKPTLVLVLGLVLAYLVFFDQEKPNPATQEKKTTNQKVEMAKEEAVRRNLASFLPGGKGAPGSMGPSAEPFYRSGFREFQSGNYLRAKQQFETALQVDPAHGMAQLYLSKTTHAIDDEIKTRLTSGRRSFNGGKLRDAKGHYEAVLRLLHADQSSPYYKEATEQVEKVKKAIKGEEIKDSNEIRETTAEATS